MPTPRGSPEDDGSRAEQPSYRSRFADPGMDRLFQAVLQLRSLEECYRFFEDLCTVGELRALAQRLHVAAMLCDGATYEEIQRATGMSSATISRIKRFLLYGADGYRLVLDRVTAVSTSGTAARAGGDPAVDTGGGGEGAPPPRGGVPAGP